MDPIAALGMEPVCGPIAHAPVWPMDAFRNRFFSAFGWVIAGLPARYLADSGRSSVCAPLRAFVPR